MINWINKQTKSWEGIFESHFFKNDKHQFNLFIYIENSSIADYAEKCVESFNHLSNDMIKKICHGIIQNAKKGGINKEFKFPILREESDILNYCWFTAMYVNKPNKNEYEKISYIIEGEGEWGEVIGFVIYDNKLLYVGENYFDFC